MFSLFMRNKRYQRYWCASLLSNLADWIRNMTLMFVVLTISHGSAKAVSINMFCEFLPMMIAPLIGVFADRWDRKRTYMGSVLFRAAIIGGVAFGLSLHSLLIIYVGAFVSSVGSVMAQSSSGGFLQQFVPREDMKNASSMGQIIYSSAVLLGPSIGAGVYSWLGPQWSLGVTVTFMVIAVLLVLTIKVERFKRENITGSILSVWKDIKEGLRYSLRNPAMQSVLLGTGIIGICGGFLNVLEVFVITEFLGLPKGMLAVLLMIQGIGMVVSTPIVGKLKMPIEKMYPLSMLFAAVGLFVVVAYKDFYVTGLGYLIFSVGNIMLNVCLGTLLLSKVENAYQGRAMALFNTALGVTMGLSMLTVGWLHTFFSIRELIDTSGLLSLVGAIILYRWVRKVKPAEVEDEVTTEAS